MSAAATSKTHHAAALVVFGLDEKRKPHASAFDAGEADLAEKAARLMGMRVLRPDTDEQRALAAKLPRGRVFGSGKAFVPFVRAGIYESLAAFGGSPLGDQPGGPEPAPTGSPSSPKGPSGGGDGGQGSGGPPADHDQPPTTWVAITVGSVVLAPFAPTEGWWEALVLKVAGDLLTLEWRDYAEEGTFVRRRHKLALLHPTGKAA